MATVLCEAVGVNVLLPAGGTHHVATAVGVHAVVDRVWHE